MLKKIMIIVVILGLAGAALYIGNRPSKPVQTKSYTLVKAWWPAWDMFQLGLGKREQIHTSVHTEIIQEESYGSALKVFEEGRADAATLTIYEAILAASKGVPLKIVLLLDYTIGSDGLVVKKNIRSLPDLEGKRIAVELGTIAHFTVLKALEKAGLDVSQVQLVNLGLDESVEAFKNGEVDAVGSFEPSMSEVARQGDGYVLFSSREIPRSICDVLFVRADIVRNNPDLIDHWIHAWEDAINDKDKGTEKYLRELNQLSGVSIPGLKDSFKGIFFTSMPENRRAFGRPGDPGYLLESLNRMKDFMFTQGVIQKDISVEQLIDEEGIRRYFGD
jgi:NitT/TauT family transport system substrate-binding protein